MKRKPRPRPYTLIGDSNDLPPVEVLDLLFMAGSLDCSLRQLFPMPKMRHNAFDLTSPARKPIAPLGDWL